MDEETCAVCAKAFVKKRKSYGRRSFSAKCGSQSVDQALKHLFGIDVTPRASR